MAGFTSEGAMGNGMPRLEIAELSGGKPKLCLVRPVLRLFVKQRC